MPDETVTYALELRHVRRSFDWGRFEALSDVTLAIAPGKILALLGPNGAGKTTTVKIAAGLLAPTGGDVFVAGIDACRYPSRARRKMGLVLGGELGFYPRATVRDNLLYFADVAGMPSKERKAVVGGALEKVGLSGRADSRVETLSRGMLQRLHIARAIAAAPEVLLLDEPTSGLDPEVSLSIRELIREIADGGTAILLTSHLMGEIEELADEIALIGAGRIQMQGDVMALARHAGIEAVTTATFSASARRLLGDAAASFGNRVRAVWRASAGRWSLVLLWQDRDADAAAMLEELCRAHGVPVPEDMQTRRPTLEEAYLALAEGLAR